VATRRCHPTRHGWCGSRRPAQPGYARPLAVPVLPWRPRRRRLRPRHQPPGRQRPLGTLRPCGHRRSGSGSRRRRLFDPEGHRWFEQITLHPQARILALQLPQAGALLVAQPLGLAAVDAVLSDPVTQRRIVDPSSRAIWAMGRPVLRTNSTASRLNSAVNPRRVRWGGCLCSSPMRASSHPRCPASGGRSIHADSRVSAEVMQSPLRPRPILRLLRDTETGPKS
jgi:hypothetical protein